MAGDVIRMVLELKDNASPALVKAARAAADLGDKSADLKRIEAGLERIAAEAQEAQRAAEKAGAALGGSMQRAGKGAQQGARGMKQAGDRAKELGDKAGDADTVILGLGGALGMLSPEAGKAATALGDVLAATEAILRSGASVARILGPVAVAVAVLAGAYTLLSKRLKEAEAAQEKSSKAATRAMEVSKLLASVELDLSHARGEITDEVLATIRAQESATDSLSSLVEGDRKALLVAKQKEIQATNTLRAVEAEARATIAKRRIDAESTKGLVLFAEMTSKARKEQEKATTAADRARAPLEQLNAARLRLGSSLAELEIRQIQETRASEEASRALTEQAAAEAAATKAAADHAAQLAKTLEKMAATTAEVAALTAAFNAVAPPIPESDIERLDKARLALKALKAEAAELGDAAASFGLTPEALDKFTRQLDAEVEAFLSSPAVLDIDADMTQAEAEMRAFWAWAQSTTGELDAGAGLTTATALTQTAGGDIQGAATGALSATGPIGALFAAAIDLMMTLGERTESGQLQVAADAMGRIDSMVDGIEAIPELMSEVPKHLTATLEKIPKAIINALPDIILMAMHELPESLLKSLLMAIPHMLVALIEALARLWERITGRSRSGPTGSATDAPIAAAQQQFQTIALGGGTPEENLEAARGDTAAQVDAVLNRSAADRRLLVGLARLQGMGSAPRFRDPAMPGLRRAQMTQALGPSGAGAGIGGATIIVNAAVVDQDAVGRFTREVQTQLGQFGRITRGVYNSGKG